MLNVEYNNNEVITVMEPSKLLLEIKKMNQNQLIEFHRQYINFLQQRLQENKVSDPDCLVVGKEYDFWKDEEDLYDDLLEI